LVRPEANIVQSALDFDKGRMEAFVKAGEEAGKKFAADTLGKISGGAAAVSSYTEKAL
jgi:hypothetical protein